MADTPAWLAAVEALLNRGVLSSTQATALARRLGGTAMRLDLEGLGSIRISVIGDRLSLIAVGPPVDSQPVDATITGSPLALFRLAGAPGGRVDAPGIAAAGGARATVGGDAEIASLYRQLIALARPDAEEELSRLVGDVPARRLSHFALKGIEWARKARRTAGENIAEYLQEESRDLVNKAELEEFLQEVDELRETADRFDARIARFEQRLKGPG